MDFNAFLLNAGICLLGLSLHFAMKWHEYRLTVVKIGAIAYIKETQAQSLISLLATVGSFFACFELGWLNGGMAFACGYMGNSIAENIANRFGQNLP